ncbi:hypothetical protein JCM8115_001037 [Rhodotorula mucilaginosa]
MPALAKRLGGAVKRRETIELNWQFQANLSKLPPEGITLDTPGPVPLPGSWKLEILDETDDMDSLEVNATHGSLPVGAFGKSVTVKLHFDLVIGEFRRRLLEDSWDNGSEPAHAPNTARSYDCYSVSSSREELATNDRWSKREQNSVHQYCCTLVLERDVQLDKDHIHHTPTADLTKALRLAGKFSSQSLASSSNVADHPVFLRSPGSFHTRHADVCLRFRRRDNFDLKLWTTSGLLTAASDYYKTLLASACAETVPCGAERKREELPPLIEHTPSGQTSPPQPTIDWQDSNDETDDFLVERDWSGCKTASRDLTDLECQQIDVRETAYSTMSAVLLYLMTGHIDFAPLKSLLETRSQGAPGARRALLDKHMAKHPTLPPPVSPKSVYRLAHLLQREELQRLALDALSTSLTTDGAAHELFSPVSIAYADVKNVILDYIVKNWAEVQASASWKQTREKAAAGEIEGAAQIPFDLLSALYAHDSACTPSKEPA